MRVIDSFTVRVWGFVAIFIIFNKFFDFASQAMAPGLDKLNIIKFRVAAYDTKSQAMAFVDPTRKDDFVNISGTQMRRLAKEGSYPPAGFMAPKAWSVLAEFYLRQNQSSQEFIENW